MEKVTLNEALKARNIDQETRSDLVEQKQHIKERIEGLQEEHKQLQVDLTVKHKCLKDAKDALKKIQSEITKMDIPTVVAREHLFSEYGVTPAKDHGRKLNGVDCHEVMSYAKILFEEIEALLLSVLHTDRCSDTQAQHVCSIDRDIFLTLDTISSKIQMKDGEPTAEDFAILERCLVNLDYLWTQAGMNYMPKIHGVLSHAAEQMKRLGGIGDLLESDLEHLHQTSKKIAIIRAK
jgi:hypothetical protein